MTHPICPLLIAGLAALAAAPAASQEPYREAPSRQEDDIQEDDIIVTGTRFETPLDQIGRSVDVIGAADIARRQQRFLIDALQAAPGIQPIRSGSFGAQSSLSVRGLPSAQTLVVQDGIVLNNPSSFGNAFNFATFDASDIERIEVLRGAQSTLYGSSAIGGVINIVTRDGADGFGGSAFVEGGSFGTFRGAASLRGGTARASARATISGVTTGGFSSADEANGATEEDGFNNLTVSTRARAALSDVFSVEGVIRYQDSRTEFDGFDFSTGLPTDANNIADMEELAVAGVAAARLFGGAWENRLTVAYLTNDQFNSGDAFPFDATGERLSYEYQGAVKAFERAAFIYGVEYEEQTSDVRAGFGASAAIDTISGYGLLQLKPVDGVTLNAGIRHDANDGLDGVAITRDTTLNGAGAIAIPNTGVTLRGSYSEGFRAPSVGELSLNPALQSELSRGWDIGLERRVFAGRALLKATWFRQNISDLIAFDPNTFTPVNIEAFETQGVEASAEATLTPSLSASVSYTYTDAINISSQTPAGLQPRHRVFADIAYRPAPRLSLGATLIYNGEEELFGAVVDRYVVLNLLAAYELSDTLELFARVENATDTDYQDNPGFGTAPASVFGGVRARF